MDTLTLNDVARYITHASDSDLDVVVDALRQRRKALKAEQSAEALGKFKVGDNARLDGLSPKYLNGLQVEITGRERTKFLCRFLPGQYTGRYGENVTVPAACLVADD